MSFKPLDNYIRSQRLKLGLSQEELSLLVGAETRGTTSRYEQVLRQPCSLERVIALEIVLGVPLLELFAGVTDRVREDVAARAGALLESLDEKPTRGYAEKFALLSRLARPDDPIILPLWEDDE